MVKIRIIVVDRTKSPFLREGELFYLKRLKRYARMKWVEVKPAKSSTKKLVQEILRHLEKWYENLKEEGFSPVTEKWKELSMTLGKRIRLVDPGGEIEGEAIGLDEYGGLVIRSDSGIAVKRMTGDVVQVQ